MVTALAALAEDRDSFGLQHPHGGSHALVTPALEDICHPFLASACMHITCICIGVYVCTYACTLHIHKAHCFTLFSVAMVDTMTKNSFRGKLLFGLHLH